MTERPMARTLGKWIYWILELAIICFLLLLLVGIGYFVIDRLYAGIAIFFVIMLLVTGLLGVLDQMRREDGNP